MRRWCAKEPERGARRGSRVMRSSGTDRIDGARQPRRPRRFVAASLVAATVVAAIVTTSPSAAAAPCSTSTGASSCTVTASVTVTAGTLTMAASPNLYWNFVGTGYDQWASGSATTLSSCAASGTATTCSGGTAPKLMVLDATGSSSGWAVSEYLSASTLPSGSVLHFNGAGSATIGNAQASSVSSDPFTGTTPGTVCDYGSTCSTATAASSCAHAGIGFATCPSYAVTIGGADATHQVDLYSATAATGAGAVCFASGSASATGCTGTTSTGFFNLGIK